MKVTIIPMTTEEGLRFAIKCRSYFFIVDYVCHHSEFEDVLVVGAGGCRMFPVKTYKSVKKARKEARRLFGELQSIDHWEP